MQWMIRHSPLWSCDLVLDCIPKNVFRSSRGDVGRADGRPIHTRQQCESLPPRSFVHGVSLSLLFWLHKWCDAQSSQDAFLGSETLTMTATPSVEIKYFHHGRFKVAGGVLPDALTAYQTFGDPADPCIVFPTCYGAQLRLDSTYIFRILDNAQTVIRN